MERDQGLDVAVTGLSARLPGVHGLDQWWAAITEGRRLFTRLDRDRLRASGLSDDLAEDPGWVPVHGVLEDADRFDSALFGICDRDAELMDPQHRLMLEVAWSALEDACVRPHADRGAGTAVYASDSGSGYLRAMLTGGPLDPQTLDQALHGTEPDFIASLVSYKLGLTGPAIGVRTACSSSLVALHLAVQALQNHECDRAVVVAAGIDHPQAGHLHVPGAIQSESGDCLPFDERADGVVAGSGAVAVVLSRLGDALADGPVPYGTVLGTAINNDGAAKVGYYAPSVSGQEAVIRAALAAADVDAADLGYLEAHATGTRVGDPIEWAAASAALAGAGPGSIAVGALKSAVGHLDSASGLAGLVKALLVLRAGVVPPVAGFGRLNPLLEVDGSPLRVPTAAEPWTGPLPRRAGVSSFGVGGTNAHAVVEQAPAEGPRAPRPDRLRLLALSANDRDAVERMARRLADRLEGEDAPPLADAAHTLATARAELPHRLAVVVDSTADAVARLRAGDGVVVGERPGTGPSPLVFLFPGQGSQRPGMARPLTAALPGFAEALDDCLAHVPEPLVSRLRAALHDPGFPADELAATDLAQPALFVVEHAAATALTGAGLVPAAYAGHSVGEITAACLAGVLDLPTAIRLVIARGAAMSTCPDGAMVAIACDEHTALDLAAAAGADVELAAVNGADSCVLAGRPDQVDAVAEAAADHFRVTRLRTSRAFHSTLIEPALPALTAALAEATTRPPTTPYAANATGGLVEPGTPVPVRAFVDAARRPVRFADNLAALGRRFPGAVAVEVGPGRALSAAAEAADLRAVPLCAGGHAERDVRTAFGALWTLGQPVDLPAHAGDGDLARLPTYPFHGPRRLAPELARTVPTAPSTATVPAADPEPERPEDVPEVLARLWARVLGRPDVRPDSDFFALGGDSLLITQLARALHQEVGVRVPLRQMLVGRTLRRQTEIVTDLLGAERVGTA
ncbi:type I polyketide synthase [Actinokineospora sp. NBRC 105648]|uniref:type I polyketide synthase n=1 Tax=Actinokineospora sp. NBRC 105648 TaxID=3032206 RepID=UPI0024A1CC33|nr:type I polyketide synthase [Actinokineospora sp. NBRC 105648]GLZ38110.1 hypothetical protein Acsp05_17340 [Actinokineospora sp. NBRC 105648]